MFVVFPRIRLRVSVLAVPTFIVMLWLEGALPFAMLMLSALLHELGHIFAMRACGHIPRRIDVLPMGALIVCPEGIADRDEACIAIAGPLVSLFCALGFSVWFALTGSVLALYATVINAALGIFNLIPIKKLDGGKALCCFLAAKGTKKEAAERFCSAASAISKCLFAVASIACAMLANFNAGVVLLSAALAFQLLCR